MLRNWIFWLVITFICIVLFIICGCDNRGRTGPTRKACEIVCWTDGINTAGFQYKDYNDELIEDANLRMEADLPNGGVYYTNNGVGGVDPVFIEEIRIESTGITNDEGQVLAYGRRDWSVQPNRDCFTGAYFQKPDATGCQCSAQMDYRTSAEQVEYAGAMACLQRPVWLANNQQSFGSYNLTEDEISALTSSDGLPEYGMNMSVSLVQQKGRVGNGYSVPKNNIVASNFNDPDQVFFHAYPTTYSYTVKTATDFDFTTLSLSAKIKTSVADGVIVPLYVIASNGRVHIIRTDYFLLEDVNYYNELTFELWGGYNNQQAIYDRFRPIEGWDPSDPNYTNTELDIYSEGFCESEYFDPNRVLDCYIVPIEPENDYVEIEIIPPPQISEYWLSGNKNFDFNNDGIVNMKDYFIQNQ